MSTLAKDRPSDTMSISGTWRRWTAFGIFSLAAHSLLLLGHSASLLTLPEESPGAQVISVNLTPLREKPAASKAHVAQTQHPLSPTPHRPAGTISFHKPPTLAGNAAASQLVPESGPKAASKFAAQVITPVAPTTSNTASHHEVSQPPNTTTQASESPAEQEQTQRNYLLGKVRSLLTKHFSYPVRARQRGWEGEVLLGFQVDGEGRLGNVHLARSSGYSLLDESALAALGRITHIPVSEMQSLQPMELQLPVLYQLREG